MTEPHHDCPSCPRCASEVATPAMYAEHAPSDDPRDLWCAACGETWRETDGRARGRAWTAWCAWLDRQERDEADERARAKRERDERRMAEMRGVMEPIDRAALRALAAAVESDEAANTCGRYRCGFCGQCRSYAASRVRRLDAQEKVLAGRGPAGWIATRDLTALLDALDAAEREADRWRHGVPIEGDYVCPTSLALDQARADLRAYGGHTGTCAHDACNCGYAEALARAEGR